MIISNQAGVEAGHKSLANCILEMRYALELFPEIEEAFFCLDFQGTECFRVWRSDLISYKSTSFDTVDLELRNLYRKPNPGMLILAQSIHGSAEQYLMVGDHPEDHSAAIAAKIPFVWAEEGDQFEPLRFRYEGGICILLNSLICLYYPSKVSQKG